jgi:hypothetical protein
MLFHYEVHHAKGLNMLASGKTTGKKKLLGKGTQTWR